MRTDEVISRAPTLPAIGLKTRNAPPVSGLLTTISVPPIVYPNGYQVSVTGGTVTSAPNAPVLVVTSDAGAGSVSVTVTPATAQI